jgi:hypothetical protein
MVPDATLRLINLLAFLVLMQPTYVPPLTAVCATQ